MSNEITNSSPKIPLPRAPRRRTAYLKKQYLPSDEHHFVGRVYDLSVVSMHFDTYEEMTKYDDCRYVVYVNGALSSLTRRVESLNHVADTIWLEDSFVANPVLPVSRFEWLNICADTFLMRFVSLMDCALLLTNEVFECGLAPKQCSLKKLKRCGLNEPSYSALKEIEVLSDSLRVVRNERFHRGWERLHTSDDLTFKTSTVHEHRGIQMTGHDRYGRPINQEKFFREGLVNLQREYNKHGVLFLQKLNKLYDELGEEFEKRFSSKFNDKERGFGAKQKQNRE